MGVSIKPAELTLSEIWGVKGGTLPTYLHNLLSGWKLVTPDKDTLKEPNTWFKSYWAKYDVNKTEVYKEAIFWQMPCSAENLYLYKAGMMSKATTTYMQHTLTNTLAKLSDHYKSAVDIHAVITQGNCKYPVVTDKNTSLTENEACGLTLLDGMALEVDQTSIKIYENPYKGVTPADIYFDIANTTNPSYSPKVQPNETTNEGFVKLVNASSLGQQVRGTSDTSIPYKVVAMGSYNIAAKYVENHLAIRIEGQPSSLSLIKFSEFKIVHKGGHWSVHMATSDKKLARRTLGTVLFSLTDQGEWEIMKCLTPVFGDAS